MSNSVILAIETSTSHSSVCLSINGGVSHAPLDTPESQAAALVPAIEGLLKHHHIWYGDITHLVTTIGPGSFTGIRIGLSVARTIAFCHPKVVVFPVTTLQCLAAGYTGNAPTIHAVLRAGKGEVYYQPFSVSNTRRTPLSDIEIVKPDRLAALGPDAVIIGNAQDLLPESIHPQCTTPQQPQASDLILALGLIPDSQDDGLRPLYIRPPDAKLPTKPYV